MNFSSVFIRRPIATTLLTIGLALAGMTRVLPAAGGVAAQCGHPDDLRLGLDGRRQPRDDVDQRGDAAGAPSGHHRRRHRDDVAQLGGHHAGRAAVRARPRHRRRRARRAGGDQRRARRSSRLAQIQSDLSQDQSGVCAGDDPGADLRHADAGPDLRFRLDHPAAEAEPGGRHRPGADRRLLAARRARRSQSARAVQIRHRARGRARRAVRRQRQRAQGRDRAGRR